MTASMGNDSRPLRQAVVVVHGMGEQRPLETLNQFIRAGLPLDTDGERVYYSRPDTVSGSLEGRRLLAPPKDAPDGRRRPQTEYFEYHWSYMMQGNRIDDLWPTFRRILLLLPWKVPAGLRPLWGLAWAAIILFVWAVSLGPLADVVLSGDGLETVLRTVLGAGLAGASVAYLAARVAPAWITSSFVDVVRYLDTSPRSYEVRLKIRTGMVDLLTDLHEATLDGQRRYHRIVIVAHSLGGYIAYDAINYMWSMTTGRVVGSPDGLAAVEDAAAELPRPDPGGLEPRKWYQRRKVTQVDAAAVQRYQEAQRNLWGGLRLEGNPWLVTDLVTLGTPMAFADRLYTRKPDELASRLGQRELPTCPPQDQGATGAGDLGRVARRFGYQGPGDGRQLLDAGAPFAVVRWTNLWFPPAFGFFGDWFGGPLAPLFGHGIRDVPLHRNTRYAGATWRRPATWFRSRFIPGYAHALYFRFPDDTDPCSVTTFMQEAMDLVSEEWLRPTADPRPTPVQVETAIAHLQASGLVGTDGEFTDRVAQLDGVPTPPASETAKEWLATSCSREDIALLIDSSPVP